MLLNPFYSLKLKQRRNQSKDTFEYALPLRGGGCGGEVGARGRGEVMTHLLPSSLPTSADSSQGMLHYNTTLLSGFF